MIFDFCSNWESYFKGQDVWKKAFDFIASLEPDAEDGKYELDGKSLFAIVQSYGTKPLEEGQLEIHKKYIDIQTIICGNERIFYSPVEGLEETAAYSEDSEAGFFRYEPETAIECHLSPGKFMVFYPEEGHMPGISPVTGSSNIKKIVVKISRELLGV
jgi:YhcH/YjgK/YiaL family protein